MSLRKGESREVYLERQREVYRQNPIRKDPASRRVWQAKVLRTEKGQRQARCRRLLYMDIEAGRLVPSEVCSGCGVNPGRALDGRRRLQSHHKDYDPAYYREVDWFCPRCHREARQ